MESGCEYSKIEIPNDPKYARAAARYVGAIAAMFGFERRETQTIETGVQKAIETAIEYSFEPGERATLALSCERSATGIKIAIKDKGLPFGEALAGLDPDTNPASASSLGRQIFRLKEFVDEVRMYNRGRDGKETVLIKHLKSKTITDYYAECDLQPYEVLPVEVDPGHGHGECEVRQMRPSEAAEVSRSVYKTYGYSYRNEYVYFPEKIVALNASGRIHSAVAVADNGEIAGHCALQSWKENPGIAELAAGVVKPEFRSRGCFAKLTAYLLQRARADGIWGIFDQAVTNHTFSQLAGWRSGLKDCALLLGLVPPSTVFKGFTETLSQRLSMVVQFRYLQLPSAQDVFVPAHHAEMVAETYKHLGIIHNIHVVDPIHLPKRDPVFEVNVVTPLNFARIIVTQHGASLVPKIGAELKALCLKKIEVLHLYLNLFDPGTARLTGELENLGFFFAGLLPGGHAGGDALILQYLNNTLIDYDAIQLESDMAKRLGSHIRKNDPNIL